MGIDREIEGADASRQKGLEGMTFSLNPKVSGVKKGIEVFNPDLNGGLYAALGVGKGYKTIGGEVGYRFKETEDGIKAAGVISSYYNFISKGTDTNARLTVGKDTQLDNGVRTQLSLTAAYNIQSGAYASASVRAAYPTNQSYGPFNSVTPYAGVTVSTDRAQNNLTAGVTTNVDIGSANLRLNIGVKVDQGGAKAQIGVSLKF